MKSYAETDPTSLKRTIAYRTRKSFYGSMCQYMNQWGKELVSWESFCRILRESFPEIKFVRVSHRMLAGHPAPVFTPPPPPRSGFSQRRESSLLDMKVLRVLLNFKRRTLDFRLASAYSIGRFPPILECKKMHS